MEILFIRHGEPNYEKLSNYSIPSYLAGLSVEGVGQAELLADNPILKDAGVIVSSPYTRALQTAAIISRKTGVGIVVEPGLHEWLEDVTHTRTTNPYYGKLAYHEFLEHKGKHDSSCEYDWESAEDVAKRAFEVIQRYHNLNFDKIIVVAHAMLIRTFGYDKQKFPYCSIYHYDFNDNSKYEGFVPWNG